MRERVVETICDAPGCGTMVREHEAMPDTRRWGDVRVRTFDGLGRAVEGNFHFCPGCFAKLREPLGASMGKLVTMVTTASHTAQDPEAP